MSAKNGGPAFPQNSTVNRISNEAGMSLRDYFAAKAMAAMVSRSDWHNAISDDITAAIAYAMADAMLAKREKGGTK